MIQKFDEALVYCCAAALFVMMLVTSIDVIGRYFVSAPVPGAIEIIRFDDRTDGRIDIVCRDVFVVLPARPKRAHQGWRYLEEDGVPGVGDCDDTGLAELPPALYGKLAALALV